MANPNVAKREGGYPSAQVQPALNPFLGLLPRELWERPKDFFVYSVLFNPLPISTTEADDIQIQADSDFLIMAGVRYVTSTAAPPVPQAGVALVQLTDSGSGRQLQNTPVHIENLFGTAQMPAVWPFPKLLQRSSTLTVTIQNLEATARIYYISFLGFKCF